MGTLLGARPESIVMAQGQCLERVELQRQLSRMHTKMPQNNAQENRHPSDAPAACEGFITMQGMTDTEIVIPRSDAQTFVIQRRVSTLKGGAYAGMRPGQSRQWQK